MSYLRQGAWINAYSGHWSLLDEHANWAQRPGNLANIGLPDSVREAIAHIPNDYSGENRKKILLTVMAAGGIRMRGHSDVLVFEFTVESAKALRACQAVLREIAAEYTVCRFNNLTTSETTEVYYSDYRRRIATDAAFDWRKF